MAGSTSFISPVIPCIISDKFSENSMGISEESCESASSSSVETSSNSDAGVAAALVTEEMFEIERRLEEESKVEEEKLREQAIKEAKERKEQCYRRLQHLLNRSNVYSNFLVCRMEHQLKAAAAKKARLAEYKNKKIANEKTVNTVKRDSRRKLDDDNIPNGDNKELNERPTKSPSSSRGRKRRRHEEIQLSEIFNKEDLNSGAIKSGEAEVTESSATFVDTYSRTINGEKVSDHQPDLMTGGVMRNYQIEALEWLKVLYENGVNGILGDEMGLGKTIECIGLVSHLIEMNVVTPFLIICPLSTLYNWCNEFKRFTPELPVILYHGSKEQRAELRRKMFRKVKVREYHIYPIVVTSYSIIMNDKPFLMNTTWMIIIDEGHRVKNSQCKLLRDLKQYQSSNRLLLTGTPLQNNLAELWSLLNFLIPEIFDDLQVFESWFDVTTMSSQNSDEQIVALEQEKQIVSKIHKILSPFLLRRTKADVDLNLPPKKELLVYAPLSARQRELYTAVVNKNIRKVLGVTSHFEVTAVGKRITKKIDFTKYFKESQDDVDSEIIGGEHIDVKSTLPADEENSGNGEHSSDIKITSNMNLMMMRKICNHPYLVEFPIDPKTQDYLIDENMVKICGKLQVLDLMLHELKKRGHKVLIFSQFVGMLDVLDYYCEMRGFPCNRLQGDVKVEQRQELIDDFNENPSSFIFLISTRAGGLGINLTRADTVIIYDSDWNPQNDLQAQDRCHRFGQTRPVVVYRLVTSNTADQRIVERACAKRKLEKMIIRTGQFTSCEQMKMSSAITPEELLELLRESDASGSVDMGDVISHEDLNVLLDRSDMMRPATEKGGSSNETESTRPTGIKGVFQVVEHEDYCNFRDQDDDS